eukprot:7314254-Pyramimonas_sp.AAC.2
MILRSSRVMPNAQVPHFPGALKVQRSGAPCLSNETSDPRCALLDAQVAPLCDARTSRQSGFRQGRAEHRDAVKSKGQGLHEVVS